MKRKLAYLLAYGMFVCLIPTHVLGDGISPSYEIEVDSLQNWNAVYKHSDSLKLQKIRAMPWIRRS